ncbi:autotransporter-associated beta strand repeat-containing protein, partial [bacterium]|nr:autotransporter-associated beta strand repeat-containing protein [bacterium]
MKPASSLFLLTALALPAAAATITWDGGSTTTRNWGNPDNWVGNVAPVAGDGLAFAGSTRTDPNNNLAAGTSFDILRFTVGASSFSLTGNGITLASDVFNNSSNTQTIAIDMALTSGSHTFTTSGNLVDSAVISGAGALIKDGAGTLTLSGANTYTGSTTITAGTLAISSNTALGTTAGTTTIDGLSSSGKLSISGGVTVAETFYLEGRQPDAVNVHILNASGNNTLSGDINLKTGGSMYYIQSDSGTLTMAGAFLPGSTLTGSRNLQLLGAGNGDWNGSIQDGALSTVTLNKKDSGTWFLTGANTYTGGTTISAGTLSIGNGLTTGSIMGDVANSGTLAFNRSNALTYAGVISGTGAVTKYSAGTLTLSATNTFSGGLTMGDNTGTVVAYTNAGTNVSALGSGTVAIGSGSTLELRSQNTGVSETVINNTFTGTGLLKLSSSSTGGLDNFLGGINGFIGTVELAYSGVHNNILSGSSVTGSSVINAPNATLQINSGNTDYIGWYGSQTWKDIKVTGSGTAEGYGALRFEADSTLTVTGSVSLLGNTTIGTGGGTLNGAITSGSAGTQTLTLGTSKATSGATLSGNIGGGTGTIALLKTQAGTVVLSGANTYTGGTTISAGTLSVGSGSTTGSIAGNVANSGTLAFNRSDALTYSGVVSGTGAVTKSGAGTRTLTGANTYSGGTTLTAGTLALGSTNAIGSSGTISFGGGTLQASASNTTDYSARFSTAASQQYKIDSNSQNVTLASALTSSGGSFTKLGSGTLTLTGANTYSGGTTISAGTLSVGSGSTTGSIAGNVANSGSLAFNRSDALTYAGIISGTGAVTQSGASTLTFTGANTY